MNGRVQSTVRGKETNPHGQFQGSSVNPGLRPWENEIEIEIETQE